MASYSDFHNTHFSSPTTIVWGAAISLAVALIPAMLIDSYGWSRFFVVGTAIVVFLTGLKSVPHKHYGVATFGEPISNWVFNEGKNWI